MKNLHASCLQARHKAREVHNLVAADIHALFARMWNVEQRLEAAERRLETVAEDMTQTAATVKRVAEVAQSAKSQARTENNRVNPPKPQTP
jgi:methyl-accepting chemotaxis protein